jgi:hypothetical protein
VSLETLLSNVREIYKHYEDEERKSGVKFNLFKVLGIKDLELFHSRFLYALLNPNGDHGKGDFFLKNFIQSVLPSEFKITENFQLIDTKVYKEFDADKYCRKKYGFEEDSKYGRFDIFIRHNDFNIIIENKIHSLDHYNQIEDYVRFFNDKFTDKNNIIIYLTLNGNQPFNSEMNKIEKYLKCKSYKVDIINWLELCNEKCSNPPLLHETINQYINTLKILTGQTRSKKMERELVENLLKEIDNVKYMHIIYKIFPDAIDTIIRENIVKPLIDKGLNTEDPQKFNVKQQFYGYSFYKDEWKDIGWNNIKFRFEFSGPALSFSGFQYGIWGNDPDLFKYLREKGEDVKQPPNNLLIKKIEKDDEKYIDWIDGDVFPKIVSTENLVLKEMENFLTLIDEIAKNKKT